MGATTINLREMLLKREKNNRPMMLQRFADVHRADKRGGTALFWPITTSRAITSKKNSLEVRSWEKTCQASMTSVRAFQRELRSNDRTGNHQRTLCLGLVILMVTRLEHIVIPKDVPKWQGMAPLKVNVNYERQSVAIKKYTKIKTVRYLPPPLPGYCLKHK